MRRGPSDLHGAIHVAGGGLPSSQVTTTNITDKSGRAQDTDVHAAAPQFTSPWKHLIPSRPCRDCLGSGYTPPFSSLLLTLYLVLLSSRSLLGHFHFLLCLAVFSQCFGLLVVPLPSMATIEPRLIHLLNDSTTPQLSSATDLPPLHALPFPASSDGLLPPIDPDATHRVDRSSGDSQGVFHGVAVLPQGSDDVRQSLRKDEGRRDGRYAGSTGVHPLRLLLSGTDAVEHSYALKAWDDTPDAMDETSLSKRPRALNAKDDFVQLPQPVKKQKVSQQAPVMPPIISGLHEPPPDAALFPPIASSSFADNDAHQMKLLQTFNYTWEEKQSHGQHSHPEAENVADKTSSKGRKRAAKPRRKWSEQETNHLLLGVNRHGVGKWTTILEDPEFKFDGRTAGDLKDRFRTCCPAELRGSTKPAQPEQIAPPARDAKPKPRKGLHSENILIEETDNDDAIVNHNDSDSAPKRRKSRAHRKKLEDLAELGISGPFKKSHRRERRPFTDRDDREILDGLDIYGPAWTKIQRDPRFHLDTRQPTDLRDRVRNKYPDIYHRIEKGVFQAKEPARSNDTLAPLINTTTDSALKLSGTTTLEPQINDNGAREDLRRWPPHAMDSAEVFQPSHGLDLAETNVPQFTGGEMDISRLLLGDSVRS